MRSPESLQSIIQNFNEVEKGLSNREAVEESNRCLYCYDAPCIQACPTGIDIPTFIKNCIGQFKGLCRNDYVFESSRSKLFESLSNR